MLQEDGFRACTKRSKTTSPRGAFFKKMANSMTDSRIGRIICPKTGFVGLALQKTDDGEGFGQIW